MDLFLFKKWVDLHHLAIFKSTLGLILLSELKDLMYLHPQTLESLKVLNFSRFSFSSTKMILTGKWLHRQIMDNVSHIIFDNGRMDVKQGESRLVRGTWTYKTDILLLHQEKFTILHSFIAENTAHRFLSTTMG